MVKCKNYQEHLLGWLAGAGTGEGVEWHSRFDFNFENLSLADGREALWPKRDIGARNMRLARTIGKEKNRRTIEKRLTAYATPSKIFWDNGDRGISNAEISGLAERQTISSYFNCRASHDDGMQSWQ
jgi:hypothetical protein